MHIKEDVEITFNLINDSWHWRLVKGKYQMQGFCDTLEKAEDKAYEVLDQLPNNGIIHTIFTKGKSVKMETGSIKDSLADGYQDK
jgi:hypothetical protein